MKKILGILVVALVAAMCVGGAQAATKKKKAGASNGGGMVATYVQYVERALQGMGQANVEPEFEIFDTSLVVTISFPEGDRDLSRLPASFWEQVEKQLQSDPARFAPLVESHIDETAPGTTITRLVVSYVDSFGNGYAYNVDLQ